MASACSKISIGSGLWGQGSAKLVAVARSPQPAAQNFEDIGTDFRSQLVLIVVLISCVGWPCVTGAEELRDPFTFGPRPGEITYTQPTLVGVLWDTAHPLAIIGDRTVNVGDMIGDWRVVEMTPGGIYVQRDERRIDRIHPPVERDIAQRYRHARQWLLRLGRSSLSRKAEN